MQLDFTKGFPINPHQFVFSYNLYYFVYKYNLPTNLFLDRDMVNDGKQRCFLDDQVDISDVSCESFKISINDLIGWYFNISKIIMHHLMASRVIKWGKLYKNLIMALSLVWYRLVLLAYQPQLVI